MCDMHTGCIPAAHWICVCTPLCRRSASVSCTNTAACWRCCCQRCCCGGVRCWCLEAGCGPVCVPWLLTRASGCGECCCACVRRTCLKPRSKQGCMRQGWLVWGICSALFCALVCCVLPQEPSDEVLVCFLLMQVPQAVCVAVKLHFSQHAAADGDWLKRNSTDGSRVCCIVEEQPSRVETHFG